MSVQAGTLPMNPQLLTQPNMSAQGPQQFGHQGAGIAPVISEVTLRVVSTTLATILEQVRTDPQALQTLCAQGQLTPQVYSNVLVESARRAAPTVAGALGAIATGAIQP